MTNPALHLASLLSPLQPHKPATKTEQRRSHPQRVHRHGSESSFRPNPCLNRPPWIGTDTPQHFEVLLDDPRLLAVNKPSGLPHSRRRLFGKHPPAPGAKQFPNANPVHRLGRAHLRHRPLRQNTRRRLESNRKLEHAKIQKSTGRWLKTLRSTTSTKSQHPSASYRIRVSVLCGPQPGGKPSKVIGKGESHALQAPQHLR